LYLRIWPVGSLSKEIARLVICERVKTDLDCVPRFAPPLAREAHHAELHLWVWSCTRGSRNRYPGGVHGAVATFSWRRHGLSRWRRCDGLSWERFSLQSAAALGLLRVLRRPAAPPSAALGMLWILPWAASLSAPLHLLRVLPLYPAVLPS